VLHHRLLYSTAAIQLSKLVVIHVCSRPAAAEFVGQVLLL
jgi:hypothetical protein